MQDSVYHVLLDGARVGPYDSRTIVGMRVRKALASRDIVVAADGRLLTVRELVLRRAHDRARRGPAGSYSVVQAVHAARLVAVAGDGRAVPAFRGELEVRVQTRVLRIEGRWREGRDWKQGRLKIPLEEVVHAGLRGALVDLGLRADAGAAPQRLTLDLHTPQAAADFASALPRASAWQAMAPVAGRSWCASLAANPVALAAAALVTVLLTAAVIMVWGAAG